MSLRQHLTAIKYEYQNKDGQGYCKSGSTVDSLTIQLVRSPNSRVTSRTGKVIILQLLRYMTEYRSWVVTVAPYYLPCKYSGTILGASFNNTLSKHYSNISKKKKKIRGLSCNSFWLHLEEHLHATLSLTLQKYHEFKPEHLLIWAFNHW